MEGTKGGSNRCLDIVVLPALTSAESVLGIPAGFVNIGNSIAFFAWNVKTVPFLL